MELRLYATLVLAIILGFSFEASNASKAIVKQKSALGKGYGGVPQGNYGNAYSHSSFPSQQPSPYGPPPPSYGSQQQYGGYGPDNNYQNGNSYGGSNNWGYVSQPYDAYNVPPHYGQHQSYFPENSAYPDHGPFYFNQNNHNHDSHYCSVHGSFVLTSGRGGNHNSTYNQNEYGSEDSNNYDSNSYNHARPRFYSRQYCRFAAAVSSAACNFCCKVVARSSNTSPDEIISAIFAFNPLNPQSNGAGSDPVVEYNHNVNSTSGANNGQPLFQCVCCAPKHNYNNYKK